MMLRLVEWSPLVAAEKRPGLRPGLACPRR